MSNFKIYYPEQLPVSQQIDDIKQLVSNHQIVIVCGETGSGKTTQLPKMLYEMGYANNGIIGHTQPRKVAARTIAHRIANELQESNKENPHFDKNIVGYKVRFHDKTQKNTQIKLMTDGILLQEIAYDKYLNQYSALVIDEVHERSLNIDFILGYLKLILAKRPNLKVIITSATIENQKLSKYFNNAPVINVQGKTFPVDIIYQPIDTDISLNNAIYQAIESSLAVEQGNILVFLPGEREIKECIGHLRKTKLQRYEILPLFSRQNEAEQNLVFVDNGRLKIIVTTNVAETSLTIPGIKFVIDSGIARIKRYNTRNRVEQLQIEPISQASSRQRAGRAGRTSHGMCIRLFSEDDFKLRSEYTDPEIIRSNLANVILRLMILKLGNPLDFPFLDMPQNTAYSDGFKTLFQLGALTEENLITSLGRKLGRIPLDITLSRILIAAASEFNCLHEALIIVSFLAIIDPRESPVEHQQQAKEKHQVWADKRSDFIAILNLWNWYNHEVTHKKSNKKLQERCYSQFLSHLRMREWHELHGQLKEILNNLDYKVDDNKLAQKVDSELKNIEMDLVSYQRLHQAILSGMLNNIGQKDLIEDIYVGTNGKKFIIHPVSNITKPKWVVSAMLSQTTKLYARVNAYIEPNWLIPITKHLVKHTYSNEVWDKKRGEVVATEHILFSGLTIGKRKVSFSNLNPNLAREIFIKQGIVLNELGKDYSFIRYNQKVVDNLENLEDKLRLSFIIIEDELFNFYNKLIPNDVFDIRSFDLWYQKHEKQLLINQDELINKLVSDKQYVSLYPDNLEVSGTRVKLRYIFNPDNPNDGVTATIFLSKLSQISEEVFSWLVPGLIREKINFIIKTLPKSIRVELNPINDFITKFLEETNQEDGLIPTLVRYIHSNYKIEVKASQLSDIVFPHHLKFHFQILDKNKIIGTGDNLIELKHRFAMKLNQMVEVQSSNYTVSNIITWIDAMNELLKPIDKPSGYLSLRVRDLEVDLVIIPDLNKATLNTRKGMLQLIKNTINAQIKYLEQKRFSHFEQASLYLKNIYDSKQFLTDSIDFIIRMSVDLNVLPTNKEEFLELCENVRQKIMPNASEYSKVIFNIAKYYHEIKLNKSNHDLQVEIEQQLDDLLYSGFLKYTRFIHLEHFPRYLQAILKRLEKYPSNKNRDFAISSDIESLYDAWYNYVDKLEQSGKSVKQSLYDFKYKIEELRVSLFAQELKTPYPVSLKRLWRELEEFDR